MDTFTSKGGEIVQEVYTSAPTQDFGPYLASLEDADAVASWFDGEQAVKLLTQYHEFGLEQEMPILAASCESFIAPHILTGMPREAADATVCEHYIPTPYSPLADFPFNQQWVEDFRVKFGFTPDDAGAGAYVGAQCVIEALKLTDGDTDAERLRDALLAVSFDSPLGPVAFDPQTRVRHMDMSICYIVKQGGEYLWNPIHTYRGIPPLGF
jgi:branched-chain amino acid transport system substrate-binding protein